LVIGNFQGFPFLLGQELRQLLYFCPMRIDLHVATLQEAEAELAMPFGFLSSVLSNGVVLYSRSEAPQNVLDGRIGWRGMLLPVGET
jgi:hypothetical protein